MARGGARRPDVRVVHHTVWGRAGRRVVQRPSRTRRVMCYVVGRDVPRAVNLEPPARGGTGVSTPFVNSHLWVVGSPPQSSSLAPASCAVITASVNNFISRMICAGQAGCVQVPACELT